MLTVDGVFLFKLFFSTLIHNLYTRKHLSVQVHLNHVNVQYRYYWREICLKIVKTHEDAMNLIRFCNRLFENFVGRQIYHNHKLSPQLFTYKLENDVNSGFSRSLFLQVLADNRTTDNFKLNDEISDIVRRVDHVCAVEKKQKTTNNHTTTTTVNNHTNTTDNNKSNNNNNLCIDFSTWKQYRYFTNRLSVQYKLKVGHADENDEEDTTMLVYVTRSHGSECLDVGIDIE
jgi:hypothetical protein